MPAIVRVVPDEFDENIPLEVGDILWYTNEQLQLTTPFAHPHVIVGKDGDFLYVVCGTSKQQTVEDKIAAVPHYSYQLFPCVTANTDNKLTSSTYFDCGIYYEVHKNDLVDKYQNGEDVVVRGKIGFSKYDEIRIALRSSKTMDIGDLLIHPEDES